MELKPLVLEGRFARLEPLEARHAEALAEAASPDLFAYHFPPAELTPEGFRAQIAGLRQIPGWCPFAIVPRAEGRAAGITSYLDVQPANLSLEIGFTWLGKPHQGGPLNPECKLLLLRHAFEALGARRVQLKTDARNLQSQRAIEKMGGVREGVLRRHMRMPDGHQRDSVFYSVIDEEWPRVRARLEERLRAFGAVGGT